MKKPLLYSTTYQLKLPLEISTIIEATDPVYTFCEIIDQIDLNKYFATKDRKFGRPRFDYSILLKIVLFAFMENGYVSTRNIEKLCKTDIRFMWLLQDNPAPSHMTIDNFLNISLSNSIEDIFKDINYQIFTKENVDLNHVYIDGTKIVANANKYSWVWKNACITSRKRTFVNITKLLELINSQIVYQGVQFEIREDYAIEYVEDIINKYKVIANINEEKFIYGKGHHKTNEQRNFDLLNEYLEKLKKYAKHIKVCGNDRNSYSKTDEDATFMRMKRDYMGNDQLLPGYNVQLGICDEYVAVLDIKQYACDMDCFKPLMEKFSKTYGMYPKYPVADAGYGSLNNYIYCEEHGMEKYMKFTMYAKETKNEKYHNDPFRAVNFPINSNGNPVCPNGKQFKFLYNQHVKGNNYGRTEEIWECEDCSCCPLKGDCCNSSGNRKIRLNRELSAYHKEVIDNLESTKGALLRMNRSIQAEGAYGTIKWNHAYTRARRRGLKGLILEISLISCGFNLHKYHLKRLQKALAA